MKKLWLVLWLMMLVVPTTTAQENDFDTDALTMVIEDFAATLTLDAAVAVAIVTPDGQIGLAAGRADDTRVATPNDHFRIGSMSKTFVAVTALRLVKEGVIALDDLAADWLPDEIVARIANADSVTLRQLLAMQSGIDDYLGYGAFWEAIVADPTRSWTVEEALAYAYDLPPLFAPGDQFSYSNTNYLLLQVILETATGQPLDALVRYFVLDPLSLENTYTQNFEDPPSAGQATLVKAFEDWDGDGTVDEVSWINDGAGLGDGALISNVFDVATFYRALFEEQTLLSADSLEAMLTIAEDGEAGYGLAIGQWETDYGTAIGHSGGVTGFITTGMILPEEGITIIVLCADADCDPDLLAESLLDEIMS